MASAPPKKRRKIRGVTEIEPRVSILTWEYGKRKPRTEMWASDTNQTHNSTMRPAVNTRCTKNVADQADQFAQDDGLDAHEVLLSADCEPPAGFSGTNTESDYAKNRRKRTEMWDFLRCHLVHAIMEENAPTMNSCAVCKELTTDTIVRCPDCGPRAYFCPDCCIQHHQLVVLHKPEQWKDGCYQPFDLPTIQWKRCNHNCGRTYSKPMLLLDHKGCPHWQDLLFCQCENEPFTLARYGFWPAIPLNPNIAVSMQLLTTFRSLVFAGQISLTAFSASLKHRYETQYSMNVDVYRALNWDMVLNFMLVHHQVRSMENIVPGLTPPQDCPACPKNGKVIAMDGNFSLVRRRAPGSSVESKERHPERFFFDQKEVDSFVSTYNEASSRKKSCSDFQAGSILRSKNRNDKLEVKGIFGSVCRHDSPYKFLDLKHGERLAYPVYLLNKVKDETRMIMYDIACQLDPHLKKRNGNHDEVTFAVPIFHVYGHKMHCQVFFSPRRIEGSGLSDGEGTERLWSFLGDFSNITKEMTAVNRRDLLTELLLYYSANLTNQMVPALCNKMKRACLTLESTESELNKTMASLPGQIARDEIKNWIENQREAVAGTIEIPPGPDEWKSSYVLCLADFYTKRDKIIEEQEQEQNDDDQDEPDEEEEQLSKVDAKLRKIERRRKIQRWKRDSDEYKVQLAEACEEKRKSRLVEVREEAIEYMFHTEKRRTRSDGQAIAKRINKQVIAASKKLDSAITKYNEIPRDGRGEHLITRNMAIDLDSAPYNILWDDDAVDDAIPGSVKRKAIDVYQLNTRAREEIHLVAEDMKQFTKSVKERENTLSTWLADTDQIEYPSQFQQGCISCVRKSLKDLGVIKSQVERHFSPFTRNSKINVKLFIQHLQSIENETSSKGKGKSILKVLEEIALLNDETESIVHLM